MNWYHLYYNADIIILSILLKCDYFPSELFYYWNNLMQIWQHFHMIKNLNSIQIKEQEDFFFSKLYFFY